MGQRSQIFIYLPNGDKILQSQRKERKANPKEFGTDENTVLAFHHQWLYGISAALNALNILEFSKNATEYENPFKPDGISDWNYSEANDWVKGIQNFISVFNHPLAKKVGSRIGLERFSYLNKEEPEMRLNFDNGDNNDGIAIIDTINKKYCFMIINESTVEETDIKTYQPLSAVEYAREFYYQTDQNKISDYDKEQYKGNKLNIEIKNRIKKLAILEKAFKKYPVLSQNEIVEIWSNYKNHILAEEVKQS